MYTFQLSSVISQHGLLYHFFADDSQLHDSAVPAQVPQLVDRVPQLVDRVPQLVDRVPQLVDRVQTCIESVADWMATNRLKMNDSKTEIIPIGSASKLSQASLSPITLSGTEIPFAEKVRNLGVFLDQNLSMENHISLLCKAAYLQLRKIARIRQYLTAESTNRLVVAFVLSRLDYCNALLAGLSDEKINRLQRIQNHAARLVLRKSKREHVTPLLRTLHWLPVRARIDHKLASLCYKCLHCDTIPPYLADLITPYVPQKSLRSQSALLLTVPSVSLKSFGERSFAFAGPKTWNSLPLEIRKSTTLTTFKSKLKTYLFRKYLD
jgi:hypothetical protein